MNTFFTDRDSPLSDFTFNYIDDKLNGGECKAYEEYLSTDKLLSVFVGQAKKGKQALRSAYQVKAADDFEEKLFKRIGREKEEDKPEENYTSA